jgi:hypothetical protein
MSLRSALCSIEARTAIALCSASVLSPFVPKRSVAPLQRGAALCREGQRLHAYVKAIRSEDVPALFPKVPEIQPGLKLFALHAAKAAGRSLCPIVRAVQVPWSYYAGDRDLL